MTYIKKPENITEKSFEIIEEEIQRDYPGHSFASSLEEEIVKRCIHTSADFDYLENLKFTHGAAEKVQDLIQAGGTLITDTKMGLAGINKKILDEYGASYQCFISDDKAFELAEEKGITRSMAAIEIAAGLDGPKAFVIGNAPTAIYRVLELEEAGQIKDLVAVIGVPVGFVGAAESKEELYKSSIPAIMALGRKGGSNIAAAIVNAIQYNLKKVKGVYQR